MQAKQYLLQQGYTLLQIKKGGQMGKLGEGGQMLQTYKMNKFQKSNVQHGDYN